MEVVPFTGEEFKELCLELENTRRVREEWFGPYQVIFPKALGPDFDPHTTTAESLSGRDWKKIGKLAWEAYERSHTTPREYAAHLLRHQQWSTQLISNTALLTLETPEDAKPQIFHEHRGKKGGALSTVQAYLRNTYQVTQPVYLPLSRAYLGPKQKQQGRGGVFRIAGVEHYIAHITEDMNVDITWPDKRTTS